MPNSLYSLLLIFILWFNRVVASQPSSSQLSCSPHRSGEERSVARRKKGKKALKPIEEALKMKEIIGVGEVKESADQASIALRGGRRLSKPLLPISTFDASLTSPGICIANLCTFRSRI